jgi:hypothetical protein
MKQELVTHLSPSDVRLAIERFVRTECGIGPTTDVTVSLLEAGGATVRSDPFPPLAEIVLGDLEEAVSSLPPDLDRPF